MIKLAPTETFEIFLKLYGARLFPLRTPKKPSDADAKRPIHDDWPNANYSRKQLAKYWSDGHPLGWALGDTDLVIDVDAPTGSRPDKVGVVSLTALEKRIDMPLEKCGVEVAAPSGGRHFYLTKPAELRIRKTHPDFPDIDFLSKGQYVVIAGSPHWQGGRYEFSPIVEAMDDYDRRLCPKVLLDLIERDDDNTSVVMVAAGISGAMLTQILDCLDPVNYRSHADWFPLFCASHHATGGSIEGREAFVAWSMRDAKFAGDETKIRERWKTLRPNVPGAATIGTLFNELKIHSHDDVAATIRAAMSFGDDDYSDDDYQWDLNESAAGEDEIKKLRRPTIEITTNEQSVVDQVLGALARPHHAPDSLVDQFFRRGSDLVCVVNGDDDETPLITKLALSTIRERITANIRLVKRNPKGKLVESSPPQWLVSCVNDRPEYPKIPRLDAIICAPTLRKNGTMIQKHGYDAQSKVVYLPGDSFPPIPEQPTRDQCRAAADELMDVFADFPFRSDADRSVVLALIFTLMGRIAVDGCCPLFGVDANAPGTGKGLLCDLVGWIAYGHPISKKVMPNENSEMRKSLTAVAVEGLPAVLFDNVTSTIGCAALDAALTASTWSDRILGQSKTTGDIPWKTVILATGNNLTFGADAARRVMLCELATEDENPEDRSGFKFPDIAAHVRANRTSLAVAALTVLRGFHVSGDRYQGKLVGSFEDWCRKIVGALEWVGYPSPLAKIETIRARDQSADVFKLLIDGLATVAPSRDAAVMASEIFAKVKPEYPPFIEDGEVDPWETLRLAFRELTDRPTSRRIAAQLKKYKGRVSGGRRIASVAKRSRIVAWYVETITPEDATPRNSGESGGSGES